MARKFKIKARTPEQIAAYTQRMEGLKRAHTQIKEMDDEEISMILVDEGVSIKTVRGHEISAFNTLFIGLQEVKRHSEFEGTVVDECLADCASEIGTMYQWNRLGRKVMKGCGSVPLFIYRPKYAEGVDDNGNADTVYKGLRLAKYWDITQTEVMSEEHIAARDAKDAWVLNNALAKELGIAAPYVSRKAKETAKVVSEPKRTSIAAIRRKAAMV